MPVHFNTWTFDCYPAGTHGMQLAVLVHGADLRFLRQNLDADMHALFAEFARLELCSPPEGGDCSVRVSLRGHVHVLRPPLWLGLDACRQAAVALEGLMAKHVETGNTGRVGGEAVADAGDAHSVANTANTGEGVVANASDAESGQGVASHAIAANPRAGAVADAGDAPPVANTANARGVGGDAVIHTGDAGCGQGRTSDANARGDKHPEGGARDAPEAPGQGHHDEL